MLCCSPRGSHDCERHVGQITLSCGVYEYRSDFRDLQPWPVKSSSARSHSDVESNIKAEMLRDQYKNTPCVDAYAVSGCGEQALVMKYQHVMFPLMIRMGHLNPHCMHLFAMQTRSAKGFAKRLGRQMLLTRKNFVNVSYGSWWWGSYFGVNARWTAPPGRCFAIKHCAINLEDVGKIFVVYGNTNVDLIKCTKPGLRLTSKL